MKSKNFDMIKTFFKVTRKNKEIVLPSMYEKNIYSVDYKFLKKLGIRNLIFDLDNTLLPVNDMVVPDKLVDFFDKKLKDFNVCILSNNKRERVEPVALKLGVKYIYKADKPKDIAFLKAIVKLNTNIESTALVGDQMLTDIKGANDLGIYSVLVDPLEDKYDIKTGVNHLLQRRLMKKIDFKLGEYYKKEGR